MKTLIFFSLLVCAALATEKAEDKEVEASAEKKQTKRGVLGLGLHGSLLGPAALGHGLALGPGIGAGPLGGPIGPATIDLGSHSHTHTTITRNLGLPVPVPQPVPVDRPVPAPYPVNVPVPVDRPYPVDVPRPYPVAVDRPYPVPVDRPFGVPVPHAVPVAVDRPAGIITRNGYPVEAHPVLTTDGFMLVLFRIPHGKIQHQGNTSTPILLQPGMGLNSVSFVDRGNTSLAFLLADAGFDVWLGNFRGSQYSQVHLFLKSDSTDYWNFSFHELGIYDIPAQISLINEVTGQKGNILYLGFSMGNAAGYVYNTIFPEEASKNIKLFINLAPVVYTENIRSVFKYFTFLWEWAQFFADDDAFHKDLLKRDHISTEIMKRICLPYPIQMKLCWLGTMLLSGFDVDQMDPETLPITTIQNTDSTSAKMLTHYIQGIHSRGFNHFSYGEQENVKMYGSKAAPPYNLSAIKVPVYIIYSSNDWLSTEQDVLRLYEDLPESVKQHGIYKVNWKRFAHSDFLVAKDAKQLIYDHLLQFLENFKSS